MSQFKASIIASDAGVNAVVWSPIHKVWTGYYHIDICRADSKWLKQFGFWKLKEPENETVNTKCTKAD